MHTLLCNSGFAAKIPYLHTYFAQIFKWNGLEQSAQLFDLVFFFFFIFFEQLSMLLNRPISGFFITLQYLVLFLAFFLLFCRLHVIPLHSADSVFILFALKLHGGGAEGTFVKCEQVSGKCRPRLPSILRVSFQYLCCCTQSTSVRIFSLALLGKHQV